MTKPTSTSRTPVRTLGLSVALALGLGTLTLPAEAVATWTTPVSLSTSGQDAFAPSVAMDDSGDAVFAWRRSDGSNERIEAQTRAADGTLGPIQRVSRAGQPATGVQVDMDADGDAVLVWVRSDGADDRVQARTLSSAGALGVIRTLSDPGEDAVWPRVAVDADGDAAIVWRRSDGTHERVEAVTLTAAGTRSPVRRLSAAGQDALDPQLAINDAGDAVCTWFRSDGTDDRVQARVLRSTGILSPIHTLSDPGGDAHDPDVAVEDDGDAYLSWSRWDGSSFRIQAQMLWADDTVGVMHTISDAGDNAHGPEVAVDDQGDAVIAFDHTDGVTRRVQAVKMSPSDTVGTPETLSDTGQDASLPQVAVDDNGDGVVTWKRFDGADDRTQAATMAFTGQFGTPSTLSDAGEYGGPGAVAIDADGDALVAWNRSDGTDERVQFSSGP